MMSMVTYLANKKFDLEIMDEDVGNPLFEPIKRGGEWVVRIRWFTKNLKETWTEQK